MKSLSVIWVALIALLLTVPLCSLNAQTQVPQYSGYPVNDLANLLKPETKAQLNKVLSQYEKQTSIEIVILIIPELNDISVEEFATKTLRTWGVGKKDLNNGLLFVQALRPRKFRSETGYGLEEYLPDAALARIQRDQVVPLLKASKWDEAYLTLVSAVTKELGENSIEMRKQYAEQKKKNDELFKQKSAEDISFALSVIAMIVALALVGVVFGAAYIGKKRARNAALRASFEKHINDECTFQKEQLLRAAGVGITVADDLVNQVEYLRVDTLSKSSKLKPEELDESAFDKELNLLTSQALDIYRKYEDVRAFIKDTKQFEKSEALRLKAVSAYEDLSKYLNGTAYLPSKFQKNALDAKSYDVEFADVKKLFDKKDYKKAFLAMNTIKLYTTARTEVYNQVITTLQDMLLAKKTAASTFSKVVRKFEDNRSVINEYGGDVYDISARIDRLDRKIKDNREFGDWLAITTSMIELEKLIDRPIKRKEDQEERARQAAAAAAFAAQQAIEAEERSRRNYESSHNDSNNDTMSLGGGDGGGGGVTDSY